MDTFSVKKFVIISLRLKLLHGHSTLRIQDFTPIKYFFFKFIIPRYKYIIYTLQMAITGNQTRRGIGSISKGLAEKKELHQ